ncbi:AraC family transcriptional regulator [Enterobacter hormaechei]|nr:helix-turn-helix domain-containing protein [Enterobacter hormaechei]NQD83303.1 AraC family transcriptional regulator [Enterobacter hormaechei]
MSEEFTQQAAVQRQHGCTTFSHTGLPVGTIAQTLGFEETTHFSKFFKRVADLTPGEFRLKQTES